MTKKENFIKFAQKMNDINNELKSNYKLSLEFSLPYSKGEKAETIVVPATYIQNKLEYVNEMYNDDLELVHNKEVKIINFY